MLLANKVDRKRELVLPLFDGETIDKTAVSSEEKNLLKKIIEKESLRGEYARTIPVSGGKRNVVLIGKGSEKQWSEHKLRLLVRRIVQQLKVLKIKEASVELDRIDKNIELTRLAEIVSSEFIIADFQFNTYKEKPKNGWPHVSKIELVTPVDKKKFAKVKISLAHGRIIGEAVNSTRALANTPGGDMTPEKLADEAIQVGLRNPEVNVRVLNESQMEELGMGGVLGVAKGSTERPKFIILEYGPKGLLSPLVLVGKGVTFDTGGLNLKSSQGINDMHLDMSGGAAIIHAIEAIAALKINVPVVGLIPAVENMPSGTSYRPGDILRSITGKTIEVLNTDAEGRIILADALGYAKRYKPKFVLDIATLTGAAMVALGQRVSALFTEKKEDEDILRNIGEKSGDYLWPLPLWDEYAEDIKGTFADIANFSRTPYGGAIEGAIFLKQFVSFPWAHIDMAPTMTTIESDKLAKGAKGTGVRLSIELARYFAEKK